ncbi:prephenate dehydrogenase dimerization domain-containing protein [Pseudomonas sp. B21-021]|uniref:prephenate dehydrogenase dimerization domain-containing protein n=1 Tax=Pseudomonas sp. B21-021 TaxID=2895476 RepID=UPI00215EA315|nr:prephenate dehydrogenase dimerization domain-containing protein [Pseudomonas sp. B21-021]UVM24859.1 prephenate dehydrogenase/arogenate dehydrogenase family protein [Pseudomonas sp. B21-021]
MMGDTVVVLGGAGLVGSLVARILMQYGCNVRVVDRRAPEQPCGFHEVDVTSPLSTTGHIFQGAKAVVFALPESVAIRAIPWVLGAVSDEVVFIPTCSVQEPFYRALKSASPPQPFVGINPMFSPKLSVQGRTVAVCLDDEESPTTFIEQFLLGAGMKIKRMAPVAHDELMALCQALPHAAILGFGLALSKCSLDLESALEVMPPPMRTMMALLSRVLVNPPEVYWDIQLENDHAIKQREALAEGMRRLTESVRRQDYDGFSNDLQGVSNALGRRLNSGAVDCQHVFSLLN